MTKRAVVALLLVALALTPLAATVAQGADEAMYLSLNNVIEIAVAQNQALAVSQLTVELKEKAWRKAEDTARPINVNNLTTYATAKTKYIDPRQAAMDLALAKRNLETLERNTRLTAETQFYTLLKAQRDLGIKESLLKSARELLAQVQEKVRVGAAAQVEALTQESAVAQAEASLASARSTLENAAVDLKRTLNIDLSQRVVMEGEFEAVATEPLDLKKATDEALDFSYAVLSARETLAVNELTFEYHKKYYTPMVLDYQTASLNVDSAKVNLDKAISEAKAGVLKSHNQLLAAGGGIQSYTKAVELAREVHRLTKLRYEVGMATLLEVEQAADRLGDAEYRLLGAKFDYQALLTKFRYRLF